jgi:hypothetical protein
MVDLDYHLIVAHLYAGHPMSFQTQLLSDKSFQEHLGSAPFVVFGKTT